MREALALLRSFDLRAIRYPMPGAAAEANGADTSDASDGSDGLLRLEHFLREMEGLLPSWSNNLSSRYFSHARTLPITIGQ
jgi:hypothetical protein